MYCCDFICTYKRHELEYQEDMYRKQFLQAFDIDRWDDVIIEDSTKKLYDTICEKESLDEIFDRVNRSAKFSSIVPFLENNYDLFKLLFTYELFDLSHNCFRDILDNGKISDNNKTALMNNI